MAIVKMKHLLILGIAGDEQAAVRKIQDLGVLHTEPVKPAGGDLSAQEADRMVRDLEAVISDLSRRKNAGKDAGQRPRNATEVLKLIDEERSLADQIKSLTRSMQEWAAWGNFDPQEIKMLADYDLHVQLWKGNRKAFGMLKVPDSVYVAAVDESRQTLLVTISLTGKISLEGFQDEGLPAQSIQTYRRQIGEAQEKLARTQAAINAAAAYLPDFKTRLEKARSELDLQTTLAERYVDEDLFGLQGWIPEDQVNRTERELKQSGHPLAIHLRNPEEDETPPVLTRNGWLARSLEPLLRVLGVPEYKSLDPSLFFSPCMILFFGICLSDAAYGAILYGVAAWAKRKYGNRMPQIVGPMLICQLFGIATILWGLITGSIFGINFAGRSWILIDVMETPMTLFYISIGCGVVHLTIAYLLAIISGASIQSRLENLGKIGVLWGAVLGVLTTKEVFHMADWSWQGLLGLGMALILFWSSSDRNILKRVGLGIWNIYGLSGLMGDVISYARLFGLGIATGAIASVVNDLAVRAGGGVPVFGFLITIVIMVIGHGFNFAMGIIGAVVHPARLHAVEAFPKFVALNGTSYAPLK
ncbi:MAG: hypothetical protein Q8P24_05390 [Desulfobacterales bacterium]|nr:hypothetical protein [Desulfobacterales bacterium]